MSDDDRKRRRLGDETKGRIADLASGWDIPGASGAAPAPGSAPGSAPGPAPGPPPGSPAAGPGRAKQQTLPPPSAKGRQNLDDVLLDISDDLDSVDLEPDGWNPPATAEKSGRHAHRPSATRSGPSESGSVDVSGLIPEKPQPPERIVPMPTVDASALGGATLPAPASDRSGGLGTPKGNPAGGAQGPRAAAAPPPARSGTRTSPPPPPGARAIGAARAAATPGGPGSPGSPGSASGASAIPRSGASGPLSASNSAGLPRSAAPASGASAIPRSATSGADADSSDISDSDPFFADLMSSASAGPRSAAKDEDSSDISDFSDFSHGGSSFPGLASGATAGSRSTASGPVSAASSSDIPRSSARSRVSSITGRLPLPADPEEAPPARPRTPSTPYPGTPRPGRPVYFADDSGSETVAEVGPARSNPRLAVPVGEFDASQPGRDQATIRRDPASALLDLARAPRTAAKQQPADESIDESIDDLLVETAAGAARDDATSIDPATHRSERSDPTIGSDPTMIRGAGTVTPKARLRTIAQLRRTRGVGGDMRYVLTAIFGLRRARRELGVLEIQEAALQQSRRRHLITLGRTAVTAEGFGHAALGRAREQLGAVEEERARHTSQVVAADGELQRVNRDREAKARQHAAALAVIDGELAEIQKTLEPLEKEIAGVTRRAAALRDSMRRIDEKIAFTEARLSGADIQEADRGAIQAEIASLRADRKSVQKDEPVLASSLDSLQPRIAKLEAARADARRRRLEAEQAERDDQRRTEELLAAVGARRKVLDRAASDAETLRDKILFELGERLCVDRPQSMSPEMAPLDTIDVELGTIDRRTMELREIVQSVDRWKIARGLALWILLFAALGLLVYAAMSLGLL